jgi:glutaminyl-tRNA synthetase
VRLYDRLFKVANPGKATGDFRDDLNPDSMRLITAFLEASLKDAKAGETFQFERHGYFTADAKASEPGKPVFNRAVTLRDSWASR